MRFDTAVSLAWVPTDDWQPTLGEAEPRERFLMGGDRNGAFRRRGRIAVAEKERKKRRKGFKEPVY